MASRRDREPRCDVCGHAHLQGVRCTICGHVGKYIVPGGPNRPRVGAIPPVPPGPLHAPNTTPPTIEGLSVDAFRHALRLFFDRLPAAVTAGQMLPPELANTDQLTVLLDVLPDYPPYDPQPSYVMAIECRPIARALASLFPELPAWQFVNWLVIDDTLRESGRYCPPCEPSAAGRT